MYKIICPNKNNIGIALKEFNIKNEFENDADLIIFNESSDNYLLKLAIVKGIKFYGGERFSKLYQYILLNRLGINTPKTYYNTHTNSAISNIDELNAFVNLDEFVVKPPSGARGVGVKKITRQQWKDCYLDTKKVYTIFKDEFVQNNGDEISKEVLCSKDIVSIKHRYEDVDTGYIEYGFRDFIIQQPIDVKREFRCLYFRGGEYLAYERIKQEGQFCGNLSHGSKPKIIELDSNDDKDIIQPMLENFNMILSETNFPWISIDLYTDKNDNIGVFEFQMEFAYEGFDYKDVKTKMINCLYALINN